MGKLLRGLAWIAGVLLVIGVILRLTVLETWTVALDEPRAGASLAPTLASGDFVLILTRGTPSFGELVRCSDPDDPTSFVVGRVAGLGGDTVEIEGRTLIVDKRRYDSRSACKEGEVWVKDPVTGQEVELHCDVVEIGGDWHYRASFSGGSKSKTKAEVQNGKVYLLSDNRSMPYDSRDYGTMPAENCRKIVYRLVSEQGWSDDKARMTYVH